MISKDINVFYSNSILVWVIFNEKNTVKKI